MKQCLALLLLLSASSYASTHKSPEEFIQMKLGGDFIAKIVNVYVSKEQVRQMLPKGLEPAQDPFLPEGVHSISLYFNDNNLAWLFKDFKIPMPRYKEVIITVNAVKKKGGSIIYWYFPKLYLDSFQAIMGGRLLGYKKFYGVFKYEGDHYEVYDPIAHKIAAEADFETVRDYDIKDFQRNYELVKKIVSRPVISKQFGKFLCSQFHVDWENAKEAEPIASSWIVDEKLSPAVAGNYAIGGLDKSLEGGLSLDAYAELVGPIKCLD